MDPHEYLRRAGQLFLDRLEAVTDDQWDAPTPCVGWDVRALVTHVVGGNALAVHLLGGASRDDALEQARAMAVGAHPVEDYRVTSESMHAGFQVPGAFERTCHHPMGDVSGRQLLGFRVTDLVLHGWDLARSTGGDEVLDPDLVASVWRGMVRMGPMIATSGVFGAGSSGTVDEEAPLQSQLLDLAGRRP